MHVGHVITKLAPASTPNAMSVRRDDRSASRGPADRFPPRSGVP